MQLLLQGFVGRFGVIIAAILIVRVDVLREPQSGFCVVGDKEPNGFCSAFDASCGIDTRTELIDEVGHGDRLAGYTRYLHDRLQTHGRRGVECAQAIESEDAVFAGKGNDVRSDRHSQERK